MSTARTRSNSPPLRAHLLPFFGRLRVDLIDGAAIERFKASKIRSGLSPKSINNLLAVLSKCLRTAQEWNALENIPRIRLLRVPPQPFDFLTPAEAENLVVSARGSDPWRDMVVTALHTGLRLGELLGLQWPDVDLERNVLTVRRNVVMGHVGSPKNNKERRVPLTREVAEAIRSRRPGSGYVFSMSGGETPMNFKTPMRAMAKLCAAAGLRRIGWHTLRHTFATNLAATNAPPRAIQELLGHSDLKTTLRYCHVTEASLRGAIKLLETRSNRHFGQQVVNERSTRELAPIARPERLG